MKVLLPWMLACVAFLSGCGGSSSDPAPSAVSGAGNWQFTMAAPEDNSFTGGIQGGFLLPTKNGVSGAVVYNVVAPAQGDGNPPVCSGSAPVTGTISAQSVSLTAVAGTQTFTLTGTMGSDGTTMSGTYDSTDGGECGAAQSGLSWSAHLVPVMTGSVQGNFHSVLSSAGLRDQNFAVSGTLTQGPNIGASNATVTGTLVFQNYPCLDTASVNGQISGNSVILHIIGNDGLAAGQIGAPAGFTNPDPVLFETSAGGNGTVIHGASGYGISTKPCPGGNVAGDVGNVCLALGSTTSCSQPLLISPAALTFPAGGVGVSSSTQTVTITNNDPSGTTLTGLSLAFNPHAGSTSQFAGLSDFTGLPNFTEQDTCADSLGATFSLETQQSCSVSITFSPQQSCPWLLSPSQGGAPPSACPTPLLASLTVNSPVSADDDTAFAVPASGIGFSALVPSTPELDFSAEAVGETSDPQTLSFTNIGQGPVQILPPLSTPCVNPEHGVLTLPRPLAPGVISGVQVDTAQITANNTTIDYTCDSDLTTLLPNFQITADACSGTLLAPQSSCSVSLVFSPQVSTPLIPALDYFLELNTLQCTDSVTSNCESDSGRFPVELTANLPSPLRMSPAASLDFGSQIQGMATIVPLTLTIFNDPNDPDARTITFTSNLVKGDYKEVDNCAGTSLPPGSSCTFTVTFTPKIVGRDYGSITLTYPPAQTQIIHLRGVGTPVPGAISSKLAKEAR